MTLLDEIRQALAELELVSHAPTKNWEQTSRSAEHPGGKRPPGSDAEFPVDAEERQALHESYHGRTLAHFRLRLAQEGPSEGLREDVRGVVKAWRVMVVPEGQPPALGDPQWKRWVAESKEDAGVLAVRFSVTRRYINMVRQQYRGEAWD